MGQRIMSHKILRNRFTENRKKFMIKQAGILVLPLNLESLICGDDFARLLNYELEDLAYSLLYKAYSVKGRNPAVLFLKMAKA